VEAVCSARSNKRNHRIAELHSRVHRSLGGEYSAIDAVQATFMVYADGAAHLMMQGYPGSVLEAVATMGSSYGFPVVDAVGRSIELSNEQKYPALCRVVC